MSGQYTYTMVKPNATAKNLIGKIIDRFESAGLKVIGLRRLQLTHSQAEKFYDVHKERSFFGELCDFMCSGPVVAIALEGDNAVLKAREIMGDTNPEKAAPGTIRKDFGDSIEANSVHGSDSDENAMREIGFFFSELDVCK